jgi:hypothetical protein
MRKLILICLLALCAPSLASAASVPTLHQGDSGSRVRMLQQRLIDLGYLPSGYADGQYGEATRQGVMAAQGWMRLDRDGVFGPQTRAALRDATRPHGSRRFSGRRVEVHLDRQVALLIDARGRTVRALHVSSGQAGYETPRGTFSVYRKERMSWARPYKVWMPWASYFTGGVALHQGAAVPGYPASHACVRMPAHEAKMVYDFASMGTKVVVT